MMKTLLIPMLSFAAAAVPALAQHQDTIHYQGRLKDLGTAVAGPVDLRFSLWTDVSGGSSVGQTVSRLGVPVIDGVFSVQLDFDPDVFTDRALWLETAVRVPPAPAYLVLSPRQPLTATPYALKVRGIAVDESQASVVLGRADDQVGIGTTDPKVALHVRAGRGGAGEHVAIFDNDSRDANADGVLIRIDNGAGSTNRDNNFLTFLNGRDQVVGRVEGFDFEHRDWVVPPPLPTGQIAIDFDPGLLPGVQFDPGAFPTVTSWDPGALPTLNPTPGTWPTVNCSGGRLPTADLNNPRGTLPTLTFTNVNIGGFQVPTSVSWNRGALPGLTFDGGAYPGCTLNAGTFPNFTLTGGRLPDIRFDRGTLPTLDPIPGRLPQIRDFTLVPPTQAEMEALICWAQEQGSAEWIQLAMVYALAGQAGRAAQTLAMQAEMACRDEGVVYGSKGADYAEWLPKARRDDRFQLGQIVGVRAGKVSLDTDGAEQLMVVSCKPIVLGNVPADGDVSAHVKVAFMGQVPVVVRGKARPGDYIVPSDLGDGTGIAIRPAELSLEQVDRIVGRAWSGSDDEFYGLVNVVVGVDARETAGLLRRQAERLTAQGATLAQLRAGNEALRADNAALRAELDELRESSRAFAARVTALEDLVAAALPRAGEER